MAEQRMRDSNFELLRILCIIGIVVMHTAAPLIPLHNVYDNSYIILTNAIFNTGVSIFVIISGYFGVKFNAEKLLRLWLLVVFYSLLTVFVAKFSGSAVPMTKFLKACFPIYTNRYWFISCYFILLLLSPFVNAVVRNTTKRQFESLLVILIALLYAIPSVLGHDLFQSNGKAFPYMLCLYWIGRYIRLYVPAERTANNVHLLGAVAASQLFVVAGGTALLLATGHYVRVLANDSSIFILITSIGIFLLFRNWHFQSRVINYASRNVLAVYLMNYGLISVATVLFHPVSYASSPMVFVVFPLVALFVSFGGWVVEEVRCYVVRAVAALASLCGVTSALGYIWQRYVYRIRGVRYLIESVRRFQTEW